MEGVTRLLKGGEVPLKNRAWDEVGEGLIPYSGGGYTNVRPPNILNLRRPAFIERLKVFGETMEKDIVMEEPLYDLEVRACGDLGFVWAPFMLTVNGGVASRGVSIYTLFRVDGNWKIVAGQDTHWQPRQLNRLQKLV
ncbi:hypothetical protein MVEN_00320500 [Mycena venus]|uniref:Uncharacterized protein n=1 Tax=Mycena venus TaxID=2733690 RepID=A0A8H6YTH0_9AGAR|nr:hypothetical protein MVEN_00320500 [Mycena venus]